MQPVVHHYAITCFIETQSGSINCLFQRDSADVAYVSNISDENLKTLTITGRDRTIVLSHPRCRKVTSKVALCGQGVYVQ